VTIAAQSRVFHLSDRNRDTKRKGTVQRVYTADGTQWAEVLYDHGTTLRSPVANLVETT